MSFKQKIKTVWKWVSSALLIVIILIVIIPSWRISFQGWYQSWFLEEVEFSTGNPVSLKPDALQWQLFDQKDQLKIFSDFKGEPVVVNFWATWCPPCRAELPELNDLYHEVDKKVAFIAVTTETPEAVENAGLMDDYDFIYFTQNYPRSLEIEVFPTLMIFNADLQQVYRQNGAGAVNNEKNIAFLNALRKDSN